MSELISPKINGINYKIKNINDSIQQSCLYGYQWNNNIYNIIKKYILDRKLIHFLNIGSHIGTLSLPLSLHINKVSAIEAYTPTYNYLLENILLNNITNITAYNIAIGNKEENVYFMSEDKICPKENINRVINNTGGMHVFTEQDIIENRRSSNLSDQKLTIKMKKLDNLDIDNFDILLVDIEGCEYDFLLGARDKILKNKPIIIIELWDDNKRKIENMNVSQKEVVKYILSMGYKLIDKISDDFIFEPN
jgi:FkbM family methyltransferase